MFLNSVREFEALKITLNQKKTMKQEKHVIYYESGLIDIIYARTVDEAAILAMAKAINNSLNYEISSVKDERGNTHGLRSHLRFFKI